MESKGLFVSSRAAYGLVYAPAAAAKIAERVRLVGPPLTADDVAADRSVLADVEFIFGTWGTAKMDDAFLDAAPKLRAVFYGAGAIGFWCTPAVWERGVVVTTATYMNSLPVAEYTLGTILLALRHVWHNERSMRAGRWRPDMPADRTGNFGSVIGLISMGSIARMVVNLLRPFNVTVLTHDPFLTDADAAALGVTKVDLPTLFADSDVVSLHAPDLPSTQGLVSGGLLASMKPFATFINTARGRVVNEPELIDVLRRRPDLQAVLDVTTREPLEMESPLRSLPNVTLTPHIAGSQGRECSRMGLAMVEELDRFLAGKALKWQVRPEAMANTAHGAGR